jgi:hypothetical protein
MKAIVLLVALVLVLVNADIFEYCDPNQSGYSLHVDSLSHSPDAPASGKPFTVHIKGTVTEAVANPKGHVHVDYAGVDLFDGDVDICAFPGVKCPLAAGPITIDTTQTIPDIAPPGGPYTGKITLNDPDKGKVVTCITFNFEMQ